MRPMVEMLGAWCVDKVAGLGRMARFGGRIAAATFKPPFRMQHLLRETYDAGVRSLALVGTSAALVGVVLALQGYNTLVRFGAEDVLGAAVGLSLIRELGPVLTGLLVTGRAASATAAGIGAMVATEQIDGLRMMAIDPVHYVVTPKALALVVAMPLLSALFIVCAIFGGLVVGVEVLGVDGGRYLSSLESSVDFWDDVSVSLLKALAFGVLAGLIATYRGLTTVPTATGVSNSTTSTVVTTSVCILIADYLITALWVV